VSPPRTPFLRVVRWSQVLYGAFVGALVFEALGAGPLDAGGLALRGVVFGLATLVFAVVLQNQHKYGLVPDYSLKCRFCNGPVNRYSEFCEHCGADLIAPEKLVACPRCGAEVYEGTKHCPECGSSLASTKKGKKGKKAKREEAPDTASVGWSTPVDAVSGFPDDDEPRR